MKINMTATVSEQPELHRGESNESGDPTMAFLAALGELLPGLIANPVTAPVAKSDAAVALSGEAKPSGVKLTSAIAGAVNVGAAPANGAGVVPVTTAPTATDETAPASVTTPTPVAPGLPFMLPKVSVANAGVVSVANVQVATEQPLIAADRVSLSIPVGSGIPIAQLTSGLAPNVQPALVADTKPKANVPEHSLITASLPIATSESAAPAVSVSTTTTTAAATPTAPVNAEVVPQGAVLPGAADVAATATALVATQVPVSKSEIAPEHLATDETTLPVAAAANLTPTMAKTEETVSVVAAQPATIASKMPSVPTPISSLVDGKAEPTSEEVSPVIGRSDHGHTKPVTVASDRVGADQPAPAPANISITTATTRTDSAPAIATTVGTNPHVAAQIAPYVAALRHGPDGTHQITVVLHPADLGQVQVVVEMKNGIVHLQLSGSHDAAREALSSSLPQLRRELTDSGLSVGRTDVLSQNAGTAGGPMTGGGSGRGGQMGSEFKNSPDGGFSQTVVVPEVPMPAWRSSHAGAVDVTI